MGLKKQFSKSKPVCKVTFDLPVEAVNGAKEVLVLGEFNDWQAENGLKMKAGKKAYTAVLELPTGRDYQFRYLIDQDHWANDWAADGYVPTPYGVDNSLINLPVAEPVAVKIKAVPAKKAPAKKTPAKKVTAKTAVATKAPAKKAAAKKTVKDDLKKIEGIGPKIAGLLVEAGIKTFADLSKAKVTTLREVLQNAGSRFKMHDPSTWAQQAKLAAKGAWDELKTLQDKLNGGRA